MKKFISIIKIVAIISISNFLLTGCSQKIPKPITTVPGKDNNIVIYSDHYSTVVKFKSNGIKLNNLKYGLVMAANETASRNYKYFTVLGETSLGIQFEERKVTNIEEAIEACKNGPGSVFWNYRSQMVRDITRGKPKLLQCDRSFALYTKGLSWHYPAHFRIEMHNDDSVKYNSFDVKSILEDEKYQELVKAYNENKKV